MFLSLTIRNAVAALPLVLLASFAAGVLGSWPQIMRADDASAQRLFDGTTFDGWEGEIGKTWRIENGAIAAGSCEQATPRNEFLATTRMFDDFELRLKFKIEGAENVNAGVQFRTARIPNHHEVSGYQADIGPDVDGHLYDESRRRRMLASPSPETLKNAQQAAPADGWQDYRIRTEGKRVRLWLNGVKTVDYIEQENDIARSGIIALQIHGGMKAAIYYRDIEIVELAIPTTELGQAQSSDVVPINWQMFEQPIAGGPHLERTAELLLNSARYNLSWIEREFEFDEENDAYVLKKFNEHGVRPACSTVYGMGVVLQTGIYEARAIRLSESEARRRTVRLIRGIVRGHAANAGNADSWGVLQPPSGPRRHWQSALWAALCGMGGWLIWDDLDVDTRQQLVNMLQRESVRFVDPGYRVPYWNGEGGDTKAEENSWNSMHLALLAAMVPDDPNAPLWKMRCSELILSSYAMREDWRSNEQRIDGKPVKEWLNGFNAEPGGVVVNHGFIHPDYMGAISMNFWALTTQSLAGRKAPESWDFNASLVYRTFIEKLWDCPPFEPPGGSIYVAGKANVYYPKGSDWSYHDLTGYFLMDAYASLYGWHPAAMDWRDIRAGAMLTMQRRHKDGRMFAKGEYDTYPGCEQMVLWVLADSYLPQWLQSQDKLSQKQNWLDRDSNGNAP